MVVTAVFSHFDATAVPSSAKRHTIIRDVKVLMLSSLDFVFSSTFSSSSLESSPLEQGSSG